MGILLKRAFVTPALAAVGLLVALGGEVESGAMIDVVAIAYWAVVGWMRRWPRAGSTHSSRHAPDVVTVVDQGGQSDGVGGAFTRLHPEMRGWLEAELQARDSSSSR